MFILECLIGSNQDVSQYVNGYTNYGTSIQWNYFSVTKRNELSSHKKTWRDVKCILLSERSPSKKATYFMIPTIGHPGESSGCQGFGGAVRGD